MVSLVKIEDPQPKVVILGAGPGGLACALEMIRCGHTPIVLEKRLQSSEGRVHPVILSKAVVDQLEQDKIYSDLVKQHKIFPMSNGDERCTFRLVDLEQAMKSRITKNSHSSCLIHYETQVTKILEANDGRVSLILNNGESIDGVDVVINAEGARSSTNELLNNRRTEVLSEILAVYSILRDDRPEIKDVSSFLKVGAKTMRNIARAVHDHAIYFFLLLFKKEHFFSSSKKIAIAATLKTPGQHRVGFAFTEQIAKDIRKLQEDAATSSASKDKLERFLHFWTRMAQCEVNVFSVLQRIARLLGKKGTQAQLLFSSHFPIETSTIVKIRSDRVENAAIIRGKTLFLDTGDALSTVDPSAVLGCNTAIELAPVIQNLFRQIKDASDFPAIADKYRGVCEGWIGRNHSVANAVRIRFTPNSQTK